MLYVDFPKSVVETSSLIKSPSHLLEVVREDPTIRLVIGEMKAGEEKEVVIAIDKTLPPDFSVTTLLNAEKITNLSRFRAIRTFAFLGILILGIILLGPRRFLHESREKIEKRVSELKGLHRDAILSQLEKEGFPASEIERAMKRKPPGAFARHWPWIAFATYVILFWLLEIQIVIVIDQFYALVLMAALDAALFIWLLRLVWLVQKLPL